tara:strand:+ start:361 stop:603 length:243 start_codon:yes stop_codon:yes gene_type:complete
MRKDFFTFGDPVGNIRNGHSDFGHGRNSGKGAWTIKNNKNHLGFIARMELKRERKMIKQKLKGPDFEIWLEQVYFPNITK